MAGKQRQTRGGAKVASKSKVKQLKVEVLQTIPFQQYEMDKTNIAEVVENSLPHMREYFSLSEKLMALRKKYLEGLRSGMKPVSTVAARANAELRAHGTLVISMSERRLDHLEYACNGYKFIIDNSKNGTIREDYVASFLELQDLYDKHMDLETRFIKQEMEVYRATHGAPFRGTLEEYQFLPFHTHYPEQCCGCCERCAFMAPAQRLLCDYRMKVAHLIQERSVCIESIKAGGKGSVPSTEAVEYYLSLEKDKEAMELSMDKLRDFLKSCREELTSTDSNQDYSFSVLVRLEKIRDEVAAMRKEYAAIEKAIHANFESRKKSRSMTN